eukprot:8104196-Alexandrium_andersonii.AAC.1
MHRHRITPPTHQRSGESAAGRGRSHSERQPDEASIECTQVTPLTHARRESSPPQTRASLT